MEQGESRSGVGGRSNPAHSTAATILCWSVQRDSSTEDVSINSSSSSEDRSKDSGVVGSDGSISDDSGVASDITATGECSGVASGVGTTEIWLAILMIITFACSMHACT